MLPLIVSGQINNLPDCSLEIIDYYVESQRVSEGMVGLSVGIIKDGEIALLKGYGKADGGAEIPATENSQYRLASVSKTVTAVLALKLAEEGDLDLNADIRNYVPEYPAKIVDGTPVVITARHLLANTSGINHYNGGTSGCQEPYNEQARDEYIANHTSYYDPIAAIDIFKDQDLCFKPGQSDTYTTWGFNLLGAVIQRASGGVSFQTLLDTYINNKSGSNLRVALQAVPYSNEVKGYEKNDNGILCYLYGSVSGFFCVDPADENHHDFQDVSYKAPGGGLIGSVIDLTYFIKALVNEQLISAATINSMGTAGFIPDTNPNYGYGTSIKYIDGDRIFSHNGSQNKAQTLIYYSPDSKNGIALMCNTRGVNLKPLAEQIYNFLSSSLSEGSCDGDTPVAPAGDPSNPSDPNLPPGDPGDPSNPTNPNPPPPPCPNPSATLNTSTNLFTINWGISNASNVASYYFTIDGQQTNNTNQTYNGNGPHTVCLYVFNNCGNTSSTCTNVTIDVGACAPNHLVNYPLNTTIHYKASNTIVANNILHPNNAVTFTAGNYVSMQNGFHAKPGVDFHAFIQSCNSNKQEGEEDTEEVAMKSNELLRPLEEIETTQLNINIYPNPFEDLLTIDLTELKGQAGTIFLFNLQGKLMTIQDFEEQNEVVLQTDALNKGIYLLKVQVADKIFSQKVVK